MEEQRKYAILFAATILAARKLNEIGVKPCPARECAIADAIENAKPCGEKTRPSHCPEQQLICSAPVDDKSGAGGLFARGDSRHP